MTGPARLAPGTMFGGEYTIVRPLAEGGMGGVYVALQKSTGRERALKVLHPWLVEDPTSRMRFEREARVGAAIESDHVVDVVGAGVDEATQLPWIAMELLSGRTLTEHVAARGALPVSEAREILAQIAHALGAAHRQRLVHRDLKPDNVMVADTQREGQQHTVKLLDFGITKLVQEGPAGAAPTSAIGSPRWMAPEQTEKSVDITPRTDVFAFGLLAFWLLTGRMYWLQPDEGVHVLLRQLHVDAVELASVRAAQLGVPGHLPLAFDDWFARAAARDPAARFADATEAMQALESVFSRAQLGVAGTLAVPAPRVSPAAGVPVPTAPVARVSPVGGVVFPAATPASPPANPWIHPSEAYVPAPAPAPKRTSFWLWLLLLLATVAGGVGVGFLAWAYVGRGDRVSEPAVRDDGVSPVDPGPVLVPAPGGEPPTIAPLTPVAPEPVAIPFRPGQAWTGHYECAPDTTPVTLHIRAVADRHVHAIFRFDHREGAGAYHLSGHYEPATRHLVLTPGDWINRPPDFIAVGLDGTVNAGGRRYRGTMTNPRCSAFRLRI